MEWTGWNFWSLLVGSEVDLEEYMSDCHIDFICCKGQGKGCD